MTPVHVGTVRVFGIDPGSRKTGWGLIEFNQGRMHHCESGTIDAGSGELAARLSVIANALDSLLAEHRPDWVAIESIFHHKNAQSALKLGHARGVALLCVARSGIPLAEFAPAEIKRSITGNGRATKDVVQRMVKIMLNTQAKMGADASDALAAAICQTLKVA